MKIQTKTIIQFISHYKYLIVVAIGLLLVGVVDEYSVVRMLKYNGQINQLEGEIEKYNKLDKAASDQLQELRRNPKAIEKIARERYFMKADDEDIYVITSDKDLESQSNAKTE